jgi:hypothetical protein
MKSDAKTRLGRRDFFRVAGIGAAAASTALIGGEAAQAAESASEQTKTRYQANSPDVQAYYRVNNYPDK